MRPEPNMVIADRYQFLEQIAVGGMGEVWLGHDLAASRDVAIKVLREEHTGEEGFLNRFRAEARATSGLNHPGVARTYAYGEQGGSAYIVMELVVAEPLSETLDRTKTITPRYTIGILSQAARALHAAHEGGVVHRDIKPGNILVDPNGQVKLTDFGIARAVGQPAMTEVGMVMGTAQYLSPEQVNGRAATPSSDIYALGIVAYEMLAGNRPFTGTTPLEIAIRHVEDPVPPLTPSVPRPLSDLVMSALDKDPANRPSTAEEFAEQLEECQRIIDGVSGINGNEANNETRRSKSGALQSAEDVAPYPPRKFKTLATWTGQRLSWLSPPLLALIILMIFALLGALVAGRIFAAGIPSEAPDAVYTASVFDSWQNTVGTSTIKDV